MTAVVSRFVRANRVPAETLGTEGSDIADLLCKFNAHQVMLFPPFHKDNRGRP